MKQFILNSLLSIFLVCTTSLSFAATTPTASSNTPDNQIIDTTANKLMQEYKVPVVSITIFDNNKIVYAKAYSIDPSIHPNIDSFFQPASIGKSLTAFGTLLLAQHEHLDLDQDINDELHSWAVPDNDYTKHEKVTMRNIMNMTSGLSVSGFGGYSPQQPLPSLIQILNGTPPANNQPVRVFYTPGSRYYYSGGGYEVLQQLVQDHAQTSFANTMQKTVLGPLHLINTYEAPSVPDNVSSRIIPAFLDAQHPISGGWRRMPETGAAGGWTTPTDLAQFAIAINQSYQGKGLLSQALTQQMLTRSDAKSGTPNGDMGLGFVVNGSGNTLNFRKQGHNTGYRNWLISFPNSGQGMVIMTDSETAMPLLQQLIKVVGEQYHWPIYYPIVDESEFVPA